MCASTHQSPTTQSKDLNRNIKHHSHKCIRSQVVTMYLLLARVFAPVNFWPPSVNNHMISRGAPLARRSPGCNGQKPPDLHNPQSQSSSIEFEHRIRRSLMQFSATGSARAISLPPYSYSLAVRHRGLFPIRCLVSSRFSLVATFTTVIDKTFV